jgi:hypothetical protein
MPLQVDPCSKGKRLFLAISADDVSGKFDIRSVGWNQGAGRLKMNWASIQDF